MNRRSHLVLAGLLLLAMAGSAWSAGDAPAVLPQPQTLNWTGNEIILAASGEPLLLGAAVSAGAIAQGEVLLQQRLDDLGGFLARAYDSSAISLEQIPDRPFLADHSLDREQMQQAYTLEAVPGADGPRVSIQSPSELGLYYGINTLTQLIERNEDGGLVMPAVSIVDYPSIPFRLGKTSASMTPYVVNLRLNAWLTRMKLSHVGLQYHGTHSKDPAPPFEETVARLCALNRQQGTLKSIVYYCPFRGEHIEDEDRWTSYDMQRDTDREMYADYIRFLMAQGAHGIEVDYNDWPGSREVPVEDILSLAFHAAREVNPDAEVLYCPPAHGDQIYWSTATEALGTTMKNAPDPVQALWTGERVLIWRPLAAEKIRQWTATTGEKPVFWVNRVGPTAELPFMMETSDGTKVFRGEFLPREFPDLVAGLHLNLHSPQAWDKEKRAFPEEELVYMATVADYLWNPEAWEPEASAARARRFVEGMGVRGD